MSGRTAVHPCIHDLQPNAPGAPETHCIDITTAYAKYSYAIVVLPLPLSRALWCQATCSLPRTPRLGQAALCNTAGLPRATGAGEDKRGSGQRNAIWRRL